MHYHEGRIVSKCQLRPAIDVRFLSLKAPKRALHDWVAPWGGTQ